MKTENYIGIELSKFLKENGCKIESEYCWSFNEVNKNYIPQSPKKTTKEQKNSLAIIYPAYHYHDIIVTHAKAFFDKHNIGKLEAVVYNTAWVHYLLQQGKQKEADEYIMEYCIFNKKNK